MHKIKRWNTIRLSFLKPTKISIDDGQNNIENLIKVLHKCDAFPKLTNNVDFYNIAVNRN